MNQDTLYVRKSTPAELDWVNTQYASINFLPSTANDYIAVAARDGTLLGLGRLVKVTETIGELGGMYVLPEYRGQQLAHKIVTHLMANSPYQTLFCIPFAHLETFYCGFGFAKVDPGAQVPAAVSKKFGWCQQQYNTSVSLLVLQQM